MQKKTILCDTCGSPYKTSNIPERLYVATDTQGVEHVSPLSKKRVLSKKLTEAGTAIVGSWEPLPKDTPITQGTCEVCVKLLSNRAEKVLKGGMFYKCDECGQSGVFTKSPFTEEFRATLGKEYTEPNEQGDYLPAFGSFGCCADHTVSIEPNVTPAE